MEAIIQLALIQSILYDLYGFPGNICRKQARPIVNCIDENLRNELQRILAKNAPVTCTIVSIACYDHDEHVSDPVLSLPSSCWCRRSTVIVCQLMYCACYDHTHLLDSC